VGGGGWGVEMEAEVVSVGGEVGGGTHFTVTKCYFAGE